MDEPKGLWLMFSFGIGGHALGFRFLGVLRIRSMDNFFGTSLLVFMSFIRGPYWPTRSLRMSCNEFSPCYLSRALPSIVSNCAFIPYMLATYTGLLPANICTFQLLYIFLHCSSLGVSSTGNGTWVNRVVYCATGTEIYISAG
jgi:hypothetical protein